MKMALCQKLEGNSEQDHTHIASLNEIALEHCPQRRELISQSYSISPIDLSHFEQWTNFVS